MLGLRIATLADLEDLVPRTRALNDHEGIKVPTDTLRSAMGHLLGAPDLGGVWVITRDGATVGYAIATFGYDLEFAGRDAWLTELFIDQSQRGTGAGEAAIELLVPELRARGVGALHLQVRPENPAKRLYERTQFVASPRIVMTRTLT